MALCGLRSWIGRLSPEFGFAACYIRLGLMRTSSRTRNMALPGGIGREGRGGDLERSSHSHARSSGIRHRS